MDWLALDIGGANLKAADGVGYVDVRPFALWRAPERLPEELGALLKGAPAARGLAVTMTGELADCYETKAAGVRSILAAVEQVSGPRWVQVYLTDGRFASLDEARERPMLAAASNWHALARFAVRFAGAWPALLIDLGSTTADIIPLQRTGPCGVGMSDTERLASGELVYTGVGRTPVCSIVRELPWRGARCPVAAELFATSADVYLMLGDLAESADRHETADGRPRTREAAHARLARMICADSDSMSEEEAMAAATAIRDQQLSILREAVSQVVVRLGQRPQTLILSGCGEFLLRQLVEQLSWKGAVVSLSEALGPTASCGAPAFALAVLAREHCAGDYESR